MLLLRTAIVIVGLSCSALGLAGLYRFCFVPRRFPLVCGNCLVSQLGGSVEFLVLGLVIAFAAILKVRYSALHLASLMGAMTGIWLTWALIGVPIFAVSLATLAGPVLAAATARGGSAAPATPPPPPQDPDENLHGTPHARHARSSESSGQSHSATIWFCPPTPVRITKSVGCSPAVNTLYPVSRMLCASARNRSTPLFSDRLRRAIGNVR